MSTREWMNDTYEGYVRLFSGAQRIPDALSE